MSITGAADGSPQKIGIALADIVTGKDAAIAILAVLAAISRSTEPLPASVRRIHTSLAQSAASALLNVAQNTLLTGLDPIRHGNAHPNLVPYQLFDTLDGAVVIAIGNDDQWRRALRAVGGLEDLASDEELKTNPGRVRHRDRVIQRLSDRLLQATSSQWMSVLRSVSVPCGIVRTVTEVLSEVEASPLWGVAPSVPGRIRMLPPSLGAHTAEVQERGWDAFR
jgi:crotonobetainyl-CoA:carnitine CoA-transferase CaiB-like acyl-CoA transferase